MGFFEWEKASYAADTGQIFGEVTYPIAMGRTALEPFARLAFVSIDTDSFKENGALAALNSRGFDQNVRLTATPRIVRLRANREVPFSSSIETK